MTVTPQKRRAVLAGIGMGGLSLVVPSLVFGQTYPAKPIRLVHGFGAGSSIDVVARLVGQKMSEALGQPVVVDSRPGATGTIANEFVVNSPADGYTLLIAPLAAVITASHLYPVRYNSLKDLAPIIQVAYFDTVLVTGPSLPVKNVKELIAFAKTKSEPLTFASPGSGTGFHLAGELLSQMAGIKLLHVPYRGGGSSALTDLMAGRVDMTFESLGPVLPHLQSGRLRALAVTGNSRSSALPDVPTMVESGLSGYEVTGWHGVFAPSATPATVTRQVHKALSDILATPDMQQRWAAINLRFIPMTSADFGKKMVADDLRYGKIIKDRGIKVD